MAKNAAELHLFVCYVLHCMIAELTANSALNDVQKNNRLVYDAILFLCGDMLRAQAVQDLGLQTKLMAPSKKIANWKITHETILCVLKQCQEQGWLLPPNSDSINYTLTPNGQDIISPLLDGKRNDLQGEKSAAFFTPMTLRKLQEQVRRLLTLPKFKLDEEVRKAFKRAYQEPCLVAHYDLSDPALRPFLTGEPVFL